MSCSAKTVNCSKSYHVNLGFIMKIVKTVLFVVSALILVSPVHALNLGEAKTQKLVGEVDNGYLEAVGSASDAVTKLIKDINAKRRAHYEKMANQNNVPLSEIQKLAGQRSIAKTAKGLMIKVKGKWSAK